MNIPAKFEVRSFTLFSDNRGYSKNLESPWIRPRSLFYQILKGFLLGWILRIYVPNLKFVVLPVPEIIGGTQKIWAVPGYTHASFSPKFFYGLVFGLTLRIYLPNLKSLFLPVPQIIAIAVLGWSCEPQSRRRGGRRGSGWYRSKERL